MEHPDPATVAAGWRLLVARTARQLEHPDPEVHAEWHRLHGLMPQLGELLHVRHGASEVWLFGSLAASCPEASGFHLHSDVDLAVVGVAANQLGRAEGEAAGLTRCVVELFDLGSLPADFAARIRREGVAL